MYASNLFDERDCRDWETKLPAEKTWDEATEHFESVVDAMDTYACNAGGTAKKARFKSANNVDSQQQQRQEEQQQREAAGDAILMECMKAQAAGVEQVQAVTSNQNSIVQMLADSQKMMAAMQQQKQSDNRITALTKELADTKASIQKGGKQAMVMAGETNQKPPTVQKANINAPPAGAG